jgi:hemerythrin superfamily protein
MTHDPITIIKDDHKAVEKLFKEYDKLGDDAVVHKRDMADRIIENLTVHAEMEEALCYPRFKDAFNDEDDKLVDEAYVEHEGAKNLLADLAVLDPSDPKFDASMKVLMEQVRHHIKEEEGEILPKAQKEIPEEILEAIGIELVEFKKTQEVA